ncbi:hypothetical protein [Photobacterium leiognathi]|uniref:hypothetical protein n=1 Tax=Photobacterium leiognathi TaxID=553611 RepID=UPI002981CC0F|nr:hypothetical protein [Photobacterium leiognathi]
MSNKYLIDFGLIPLDVINLVINEHENVDFIVEDKFKYQRGVKYGLNTSRFFLTPCLNAKGDYRFYDYNIVQNILMDYKTLQLFDRTESVFHTISSKIRKISSKIEAAIKLIKSNNYTDLIFTATPHNCNNWILAKVAEYLGCKVHYFKQSVIPWRYSLYTGLSMNAKINHVFEEIDNDEVTEINDFLDKKRGGLEEALPDYEKKRILNNKGKLYSIRREINYINRPDLLFNKLFCWIKYNKLSVSPELSDKYIVFFLHFQPERTTLPEGYGFTQQVLAIKALRKNTPKDIKLYVKEHPSTFTNHCHWKEKDTSFYEEIANIEGVYLVDINFDQYKMIDKSIAVGSITGTVLFESIVRNVPSIAFGLSPYIQSEIHHKFKDEISLKNFINRIYENSHSDCFYVMDSLTNTFSVKKHSFIALQPGTNDNHIAAAIGIMKILDNKFSFSVNK